MNGTSKCRTREGWLSPPIDLGVLLQEDEEQDDDNDHHGGDHVWMIIRR